MSSSASNASTNPFEHIFPEVKQPSTWTDTILSGVSAVASAPRATYSAATSAISAVAGMPGTAWNLTKNSYSLAKNILHYSTNPKDAVKAIQTSLIEKPPEQFIKLHDILDQILNHSQPLTEQMIKDAQDCLNGLTDEELARLAPQLPDGGKLFIREIKTYFQTLEATRDISHDRERLNKLLQVCQIILEMHKGKIVQGMAYLKETLIDHETGLYTQTIDILKNKLIGSTQSTLKPILRKLTQLFDDSPNSLRNSLSESERKVVDDALALLRQKTTSSSSSSSEVKLEKTDEELLIKAIEITQQKIIEKTNAELKTFLNALQDPSSLLFELKAHFSKDQQTEILRCETLIDRKLSTLNSWTAEECTVLAKTLNVLSQTQVRSHHDVIQQGFELIQSKLSGSPEALATLSQPIDEPTRTLLTQANTRLRSNWVATGTVVNRLTHYLFKAEDQQVIEAITFLLAQLKEKQTETLTHIHGLIQNRLSADEEAVAAPLRLSQEERSALVQMQELLTTELDSADPSGNRLQTILKDLPEKLALLQKKHTTAESALEAARYKSLLKQLKKEQKILSQLHRGITDPSLRNLLFLMKTASDQLIVENGPLSLMKSQIDSQEQALISQAIDLLNQKMFEVGGPVDGLRRTLVDDGGIFDELLRLLSSGLLDEEKGILTQATAHLKRDLLDETDGAFVKALDILNAKLNGEDGVLATLDKGLNDEEKGILVKAVRLLDEKLNQSGGFLDRLNARLNAATHPKIAQAMLQIQLLQDTILKNGAPQVQKKLASELRTTLQEIDRDHAVVFKDLFNPEKNTLRDQDLEQLRALADRLADYTRDPIPSAEQMHDPLTHAIEVLEHHYRNQQGLTARTADTLLKQTEKAFLGPQGILDQFNDKINTTAHPYLIKARKELGQLKQAMQESGSAEDLLPISQALARTLSQIDADHANVFAKSILRFEDLDKIHQLQTALSTFTEEAHPSLEQMQQHFEKMGELLNHHCVTQAGIIARTTDNLATQISDSLLQPNGPMDMLDQRLNSEAHPALQQSIQSINALKAAIARKAIKPHLSQLAANAARDLETIARERDAIFARHPARSGDLKALRDLRNSLQRFTATEAPSMEELAPTLQPAEAVINHHFRVQGGIVANTAHNFSKQMTQAVNQKDGFVDQFGKKLTALGHEDIGQAREALSKLHMAITTPTGKQQVLAKAQRLKEAIEKVVANRQEIFQDPPLRDLDIETLEAVLPSLQRLNDETPPRKEEILEVLKKAQLVLDYHYHAQAGYADQFVDAVTKGLDPLMTRFENWPRAMYDAFMGRDPETGAIEHAPEQNGDGSVSLGSFMNQAYEYLVSEGASTASKKTIEGVSAALIYAFDRALESIEGDTTFDRPREKINAIMREIRRIQSSESAHVSDLKSLLGESLDIFNTFKIYVNGFRVPRVGTLGEPVENPEETFLSNIAKLRSAQQRAPEIDENEQIDWKQKAQDEKEVFVNNTTKFLAIKLIYEQFCGLTPANDQMYFNLMHEANSHEDPNEALKEGLFQELENAKVGWFKRTLSHGAYFIFSHLLTRFIQNLSTTYLDDTFKFIDDNKDSDFINIKNMLINNFTRYLTILGGAYERIAFNTQPGDRIQQMLNSELDKPEYNCGKSTKELYSGLAQEVLKKSLKSSFLVWIFRKLIGDEEMLVNAIINQSVGSLMDVNGYTHALNSVIVEQLEEVLKIMEQQFADAQETGKPVHHDLFSKHKRMELASLVKNLFEILQKSKCQTKDELKALLEGRSFADNAVKMVDDLFIQDVIENITNMMALTIGTLVKEDQLHKLLYKFTSLVNTVYAEGKSYPVDEVAATEKKLTQLSDRILNLSILTAVGDKFDFTGDKEQCETNRQIETLRVKTEELVTQADSHLNELSRIQDFTSIAAKAKLKEVVDEALAYEMECSANSFESKSSSLNADNKEELKARYLQVAKNSEPYVQSISKMRIAQQEISEYAQLQPELLQIADISGQIVQRVATNTPSLSDVEWAKDQIQIIEHHFTQAHKIHRQPALYDALIGTRDRPGAITELAIDLNQLHNTVATIKFAENQANADALINQIAEAKQQTFGALILPSEIKQKIEQLKSEIRGLNNPDLCRQLFAQIQAIQNSHFEDQLNTALTEYRRLSLQFLQAATAQVTTQKTQIQQHAAAIQQKINSSEVLAPNYIQTRKETIQQMLVQSRQGLNQIRSSYQKAHKSLTKAEQLAIALKKAIKNGQDIQQSAQALLPEIQELLTNQETVFQHSTLRQSEGIDDRQTLESALGLVGQWASNPPEDKESAEKAIIPLLDMLSYHTSEQSKPNIFKPLAYQNFAVMDMNGFKNWAAELVFGRVKERVDGLMQFIRREDTYRFGLTNHMFLIPYLKFLENN